MARKSKDRIPVGKDGFVPKKAIVARFQEVGDPRDSSSTHSKVLPQNLTPKEIMEWWDDPSSCDIDGIDTADSPIYSVPASIRGRKRKALSRIAVISGKKEADRIKRVLADRFTVEELELLAEGRSLIISTVPHLSDCTGFYLRQQEGVPVPEIVLETGTTDDGIVHEVVHALRAKDGRTAYPTKDGVLDPAYSSLPKQKRKEILAKEEKETVAETVARTKPDKVESGYYDRIPGMDGRTAYLHDQAIISRSKALKGKAAIKAAERNYDRSTISRAVISGNAKKRRKRCSDAEGSRSAPRKTPRDSLRRSGTSTTTSVLLGYSSTATPGHSIRSATSREPTAGGGRCATAWILWNCTARPPPCPMSRSQSTSWN